MRYKLIIAISVRLKKKTWRLSKTMRTFIGIVLLILIYPVLLKTARTYFLKLQVKMGKILYLFTTNEVKK